MSSCKATLFVFVDIHYKVEITAYDNVFAFKIYKVI